MHTLSTLRALFAHNDWARDRLLESAASLRGEMLQRRFEMGRGSLGATLRHLWSAERWWLNGWLGTEPPPRDPPDAPPSLSQLRERFDSTARHREEFLADADESGVIRFERNGRTIAHPLGDMMLHVCNHGVHHRAQALHMLRTLGVEPPGLDYITMKMESSDGPAIAFDVDTIAEYFRYSDWARRRVHAAAATLDSDALDRPVDMGLGSIRRILLHIRDAEQWWLDNWMGRPADAFECLAPTTTIAALSARMDGLAEMRHACFDGVRNEDLQRSVTAHPPSGTELVFRLGDTMLQLPAHGTHHRAQVVNLLRAAGVRTPGLDSIDWVTDGAGRTVP